MGSLTRIDDLLRDDELFSAIDTAASAFQEWSSLLKTSTAYYCSSDSDDIEQDHIKEYMIWLDDDANNIIIPRSITEGHVVDLGIFGIHPEKLYDTLTGELSKAVQVMPTKGIVLPPQDSFIIEEKIVEGDMTLVYLGSEHDGDQIKVYILPSTKPLPSNDGLLFDEVVIKPSLYLLFLEELLSIVKYRFSALQPMFVDCGCGSFLPPQIDPSSGCICIPYFGMFPFRHGNVGEPVPYGDSKWKIEDFIQTTMAKFDCIQEEAIRRKAMSGAGHIPRSQNASAYSAPRSNGKWSSIMTKKKACSILGWSIGTLNAHIIEHPGIAQMQRNRQHWRFDCNDPSFASLPLDNNFNNF